MASKPVVLLVHGMGGGAPPDDANGKLGTMGESFVKSANSTLQAFGKHIDDSIKNYVEVEEFYYNDTFERIAREMSNRAKTVKTRFDAVQSLFPAGSFLETFIGEYSGWESKFADDKFFYTHWLDVIFYTTYIGEPIRIALAKKIADVIRSTTNSKQVHIIAHSLGTALVHDTLHKLYPANATPTHDGSDWFSVENQQLGSVWMVANVSKLVNSIVGLADPTAHTSTVKPGAGGCAKRFYNVRHELDPFTMIHRFDPRNDGQWISHNTYRLMYRNIENELVIDPNTHSFAQSITDPQVGLSLLPRIMGTSKFKTNETDKKKLIDDHAKSSIPGAFSRLRQSFSSIQLTDLDSISDFLATGEQFRKAIEHVREQLEA